MLDYPQLQLDFMNHDHAEFVDLHTELLSALTDGAHTAVSVMLDGLLEHTRRHFAEEEGRMREAQFPPYAMHKGEHDRVLVALEARIAQWRQDHDDTALHNWLEHELGNWFVNHVNTMDFVTARFIAAATMH